MSSNNQIVILKKNGKYYVYEHLCVDNDFIAGADDSFLIGKFLDLKQAITASQKYMQTEIVEYGISFGRL